MNGRVDVQYVNYYNYGSAARKIELRQPEKKVERPRTGSAPRHQNRNRARRAPQAQNRRNPRRRQRTVIYLDTVALSCIAVSVFLLICMFAGVLQLNAVQAQELQMKQYVQSLMEENEQLQQLYESGYDLEQIKQEALAMGLVPEEQAQRLSVTVLVPDSREQAEQTNMWEEFMILLSAIFA